MLQSLLKLAEVNIGGAPFLLSFGLTWLLCGLLWRKVSPQTASLATLFQSLVALPPALIVLWLNGAFNVRDELGVVNELGIILSLSQLLILPFLIVLFRRGRFTLIPFVFIAAAAIHFVPFFWLYREPVYIVMPILSSLAAAIIYYRMYEKDDRAGASVSCLGNGVILMLTGLYLLLTYLP